jgi:hypothetical protein
VVVEHELRDPQVRQLVVAGPGLGVHQREGLVAAPGQVPQMRQLELEAAHHLAVLGAADQTAVGGGDPQAEAPGEQLGQERGGGQGVRVRVVVGEHQEAPAVLGDAAVEFRQPFPGRGLCGGRGHGWRIVCNETRDS